MILFPITLFIVGAAFGLLMPKALAHTASERSLEMEEWTPKTKRGATIVMALFGLVLGLFLPPYLSVAFSVTIWCMVYAMITDMLWGIISNDLIVVFYALGTVSLVFNLPFALVHLIIFAVVFVALFFLSGNNLGMGDSKAMAGMVLALGPLLGMLAILFGVIAAVIGKMRKSDKPRPKYVRFGKWLTIGTMLSAGFFIMLAAIDPIFAGVFR